MPLNDDIVMYAYIYSHTRKSACRRLSCLMGHASKQPRHSTEPYPPDYTLARHADANEPSSTCVSWYCGKATSNFSAASHSHAVTQRRWQAREAWRTAAVSFCVWSFAARYRRHVTCSSQGVCNEGKAYCWRWLPEDGSGSAKASMSERSRGWRR